MKRHATGRLRADRKRVTRRLLEAVSISSVNPRLGGRGEAHLGAWLVQELTGIGLRVFCQTVQGERFNVIASRDDDTARPTLAFAAHLDTVDGSKQRGPADLDDGGRVHGRGACDAKGSLVAMVEALHLVRDHDLPGRLILVGTIDEEVGGLGAREFLRQFGSWPDAAIVGKPTGLDLVIAHKGMLQFWIRTEGRTAHAARAELGVNAVVAMAEVIKVLEFAVKPYLREPVHPLLGPPSIAITKIEGGTANNVIPGQCRIAVDRRLNPGEIPEAVLQDLDRVLDVLSTGGIEVVREPPVRVLPPLETAAEGALVSCLRRARESVLGEPGPLAGAPFTSDGSLFSRWAIPTVVFGPGSIDRAHTDDEWVPVEEVARAAEILAQTALDWPGGEARP